MPANLAPAPVAAPVPVPAPTPPTAPALPPAQPHPLGPRDVIELLTGPIKVALVAVAVVVALAMGYQLGRDSNRLTLLSSPRARTGVAWSCGGQLTATVAFEGLGVSPVQLLVGGAPVPAAATHRRDGAAALIPDDGGRLEAVLGPVPYTAGFNRVQVVAVDVAGDVAPREISVPVLPCDLR